MPDNVAESGAKSVTSKLSTKIGPLPAWAWVAIPAAAYVIYAYYRAAAGGKASPDPDVPETMDEFINTGTPVITGGYSAAPNGTSNPVVTPTTPPTPTIEPEAPTSVTSTLRGNNVVRVNWAPPMVTNGTIIGYRVSQNLDGRTLRTTLKLPNERGAEFDVQSGKTYTFNVAARNAKGWGARANTRITVP